MNDILQATGGGVPCPLSVVQDLCLLSARNSPWHIDSGIADHSNAVQRRIILSFEQSRNVGRIALLKSVLMAPSVNVARTPRSSGKQGTAWAFSPRWGKKRQTGRSTTAAVSESGNIWERPGSLASFSPLFVKSASAKELALDLHGW